MSALEYAAKDGFRRRYEQGAIYLSPTGEAHELHGAIYQKYVALGGDAGFLGYPQTDEQTTVLGTGRFNHFEGGSIYWTAGTGAWELHGAIRDRWWQLDGDRSQLGYPLSDEEAWRDASTGQYGGRVSYFQRGSIVFRSSPASVQENYDAVIFATTGSATTVTYSAELWMNSAGDWRFKGHMHNSGLVGFNVTVVATPRFQDGNGNIFTVKAERHLDGTTSLGDERSDDWDQLGKGESFIRENWDFLRYSGMRSVLDVNTTFGDIVQVIVTSLPIAVGLIIVGAISGGGQVCPARGHISRNPYTHEDEPTVTFDVIDAGEKCPEQ